MSTVSTCFPPVTGRMTSSNCLLFIEFNVSFVAFKLDFTSCDSVFFDNYKKSAVFLQNVFFIFDIIQLITYVCAVAYNDKFLSLFQIQSQLHIPCLRPYF